MDFNGPCADYIYDRFMQNGSCVFEEKTDGKFQSLLEDLTIKYRAPSAIRELLVSNAMENILVSLLSSRDTEFPGEESIPKHIHFLLTYIENNYMNHLTLDFLSQLSGYSKYYLIRQFKKFTGYTPGEYIIQNQLENSKVLLSTTDLTVKHIGETVGIKDEIYFGKLFKSRMGKSPLQFRRDSRRP